MFRTSLDAASVAALEHANALVHARGVQTGQRECGGVDAATCDISPAEALAEGGALSRCVENYGIIRELKVYPDGRILAMYIDDAVLRIDRTWAHADLVDPRGERYSGPCVVEQGRSHFATYIVSALQCARHSLAKPLSEGAKRISARSLSEQHRIRNFLQIDDLTNAEAGRRVFHPASERSQPPGFA